MLKLRTNVGWREVDMDIGSFKALVKQQEEQIAALPSPEESMLKLETTTLVNDLLANKIRPNEREVLRGMNGLGKFKQKRYGNCGTQTT